MSARVPQQTIAESRDGDITQALKSFDGCETGKVGNWVKLGKGTCGGWALLRNKLA